MKQIFIFGASGHAKVVIDVIEAAKKYEIVALFDDAPGIKSSVFYGYPVLGGKKELLQFVKEYQISSGIVAIGDNETRSMIAQWCVAQKIELLSAIHPAAIIAKSVNILAGTVVMAGAVINADSQIGENTVINSSSVIDHECQIGSSAHIAPGAVLCGNTKIGNQTLIGAGATIIPNLKIGSNVVVGAGAAVVKNIPNRSIVAGIPAKPIN